jgi:hypothetical protein
MGPPALNSNAALPTNQYWDRLQAVPAHPSVQTGVSMDSSPIAALSTQLVQQQTAQSAQISVAKKAMDSQAQTAAGLIEGMNKTAAALPDHLGNTINTTA